MTLNTFTSGLNTSFSTELNENFNGNKILEIYTGSGFDTSISGAGTTTSSIESTAISSSAIGSADYIEISITAFHRVRTYGGYGCSTLLHIESKEISGSYSDSMTNRVINDVDSGGSDSILIDDVKTVSWIHTLTAGEKANGVQFRISSSSQVDTSGTTSNSAVTNYQTVIKTVV